ncbi:MAG: hypothetical protein Q9218_002595 [Villophora microphyllina]
MANSNEIFVADQEAIQQMDDWLSLESTNDKLVDELFTGDAVDLPTESEFRKIFGNAPASGPSLSGYPPPDMLADPKLPYPGNTQYGFLAISGNDPPLSDNFADLLQEQSVSYDQNLWASMLNAPASEAGYARPQSSFPGYQDRNLDSSTLPTLHNATPAQLSRSSTPTVSSQHQHRPPPLSMHPKPDGAQAMGRQYPLSPDENGTSGSEWTPSGQPAQHSRKRKATSPPAEDFPDDDLFVTAIPPAPKKLRVDAAITTKVSKFSKSEGSEAKSHPRTRAIRSFDGSKVYSPPAPRADWSIFKYNRYGELQTSRQHTTSEIHDYLHNNPLNFLPDGTYNPKKGGFRLRIQRNPSDSRRRYPSAQSNRCRFRECFATNNLINQGQLRVCFDESQSYLTDDAYERGKSDPLHCAGFVHLNCLERLLDFPSLCATLPIMPDTRHLPHEYKGYNRMEMIPFSNNYIATSFISDCEIGCLTDYPAGARPHEGSLAWRLMKNKVEEEGLLLLKQKKERGRPKKSHQVGHMGDLEVESKVRDLTRTVKYQAKKQKA